MTPVAQQKGFSYCDQEKSINKLYNTDVDYKLITNIYLLAVLIFWQVRLHIFSLSTPQLSLLLVLH